MSKKTIKINPELFQISSEKTRKNREKISRPNIPVLVNPNSIKKQLLNKIKEHKAQEKSMTDKKNSDKESESVFSDEFKESIEYLSSLSKQQKEKPSPKTLKNHTSYSDYSQEAYSMPHVELDLPEELITVSNEVSPIKINPSSVPYGCLKNGQKPTYRVWHQNQTRKNYDNALTPIINPIVTEREKRLEALKYKMRETQEKEFEKKLFENPIIQPSIIQPSIIQPSIPDSSIKEKIPPSTSIKKTIRRKYKLGKSLKHRKIGVLIKDKNTRRKIIDAQKELKKKSIPDVKKYLKDRGLIKAGSNAPNDVLRKTYESAMLSGDIANVNRETLMHNFLNETQS